MPLVAGFFVPHPPIILPEVGRGEERKIQETINAYENVAKQIKQLQPDTIILTSPHAIAYRSYYHISTEEHQSGNLSRFMAPQVSIRIKLDMDLTSSIIDNAENDQLPLGSSGRSDTLDHGSMIPLRYITNEYDNALYVRISPSTFSPQKHYQMGQKIASLIPSSKRVVWVASGDLSHTLKKDGPYGLTKEGPDFDRAFLDIVTTLDANQLFNLDEKFVNKAAVCGLGSFSMMLGALSDQELRSELLSYQDVFGVGYAVASFYPKNKEAF